MITGILTWTNETGRTSYPLQPNQAVTNDVIVDARFVQFDGFIPVLQSILVGASTLTLTIQFDLLTLQVVYEQSSFTAGTKHLTIYDNENSYNKRYLGRIVFGDGVNDLWNNRVSQLLTIGVPFTPNVVRSVPSGCGLFTLGGRFGALEFAGDPDVNAVFFTTSPDDNWVAFNAVGNFMLPGSPPSPALKLLNLVAPIDNNITIGTNDIIKVTPTGATTLAISLIGNTSNTVDSIVSTLAS